MPERMIGVRDVRGASLPPDLLLAETGAREDRGYCRRSGPHLGLVAWWAALGVRVVRNTPSLYSQGSQERQ